MNRLLNPSWQPRRHPFAVLLLIFVAAWNAEADAAKPAVGAEYSAADRTLTISIDDQPRYRYVFNKGGAINSIYDLKIAPKANLVGESYRGETTDRVIQWTYWNSRYRGKPHDKGSKETRANVTMEGCYDDKETCEVIETPKSGKGRVLVFKSRITHWFFAEMSRHGRPDFRTTSRYEVLDDGSLKLTRTIHRKPWVLKDVTEQKKDGTKVHHDNVLLESVQVKGQRVSSYLEGWTPMRRTVLPKQKHGKGTFEKDGYRFWNPEDLGGWAMAYSDTQAFAVLFGLNAEKPNEYKTRTVFNKLDLANHRLNILLPAVVTDWPDNASLTQTLIFVVGEPTKVASQANGWVKQIKPPFITLPDSN